MKNVEIAVYPIASTATNPNSIRQWLNGVGAVGYEWPRPEEEELTNAEALVGVSAKRCYMSFEPGLNPNVTKVRKDWNDYFENILKSGHGSVMEHASYTFAIEGVSRVFTGEMNRHRAGVAISEGSMRYIRFTDIPWWMPNSLRLTDLENNLNQRYLERPTSAVSEFTEVEKAAHIIGMKKKKTQESFARVFQFVEKEYTDLVEMWQLDTDKTLPFHFKKILTSCLRRIIPMGVATGGIWTLNMRALRHIIALRTSAAAEEEIAHVFSLIAKHMCQAEPRLLGDFEQTSEGYWVPKYPKV